MRFQASAWRSGWAASRGSMSRQAARASAWRPPAARASASSPGAAAAAGGGGASGPGQGGAAARGLGVEAGEGRLVEGAGLLFLIGGQLVGEGELGARVVGAGGQRGAVAEGGFRMVAAVAGEVGIEVEINEIFGFFGARFQF